MPAAVQRQEAHLRLKREADVLSEVWRRLPTCKRLPHLQEYRAYLRSAVPPALLTDMKLDKLRATVDAASRQPRPRTPCDA